MKTLPEIQDLKKFQIRISRISPTFFKPADRWGYQRVPRTDAKRPSDAPRVLSEAFAAEHCMPHP
jgi:hypothetical protein